MRAEIADATLALARALRSAASLLLMTDKELGLFDALQGSWNAVTRPPVADHIVVVIIYVAIMSLGSSLWFAFLITQPMATFIMIEAYQSRVLGGRVVEPREEPQPEPEPEPETETETETEIETETER